MVGNLKRDMKVRLDCEFVPAQCPEPGNPWGSEASFLLILYNLNEPLAVVHDVCSIGEARGKKEQLSILRIWAKSKGLVGHGPVAWGYTLKAAESEGRTVVSQWTNHKKEQKNVRRKQEAKRRRS